MALELFEKLAIDSITGKLHAVIVHEGAGILTDLGEVDITSEPTGTIKMYSGTTAPDGWMICDGRALLQSEYPELYAVCGLSYWVDAQPNEFNIPDFRDVSPMGKGAAFTNLGYRDAAPTHTHNLPQTATGNATLQDDGHYHYSDGQLYLTTEGEFNTVAYSPSGTYAQQIAGFTAPATSNIYDTGHAHGFEYPTDGGTALAPLLIVNFIIKT